MPAQRTLSTLAIASVRSGRRRPDRAALAALVLRSRPPSRAQLAALVLRPRPCSARALRALGVRKAPRRRALLALLALLAAAAPPLVPGSAGAGEAAEPMRFGMDVNSIAAQAGAGVKPDYGLFWVGVWNLKSGWSGPDAQMDKAYAAGVTPVIQFYYWGDDIRKTCIEQGCWSDLHNSWKDRANWSRLAQQLVDHLHTHMKGRPAVVVLETEFNKGSVATYEPLDAMLEEKARFFRQGYPNATLVLGFGNWGREYWGTWDRAAGAVDMTGLQAMRGSTRNSLSSYYGLVNGTLDGAERLQALFRKPVFVSDIALSSYPEPEYLGHQARVMESLFDRMAELKAAGIKALVYRTWKDNPGMDLANYYGEAERHWGVAWASNLTGKPARDVWVEGVKAERAGASGSGAPPPPPPAPTPPAAPVGSGTRVEAEGFATKGPGAAQGDAAASGGRVWNLWSNGALAQAFDFPAAGAYHVAVRARGTLAHGVGPHLAATLGGAPLLEADLGTSFARLAARTDVARAGPLELRLGFTNDARTSTEDRNLLLDVAEVWPNRAPAAALQASAEGLAVQVRADGSLDPDGDPLRFAWDFGDGAKATGPQAAHAYAAPGTYTIRMVASDGAATASASRQVEVRNPNEPPRASFTWTASGLDLRADASGSTDPDGDALSYAWTFGDGTWAQGVSVAHTYARPGNYTVKLTVRDGELGDERAVLVGVAPPPFRPAFEVAKGINEWWVEVRVTGSPKAVDASADGGAWRALRPTSWGTWAASFHVPQGSAVRFRATDAWGQQATSPNVTWLGPPFAATFEPRATTNSWWVEVDVDANAPVKRVEARVNGGAWRALDPTSWGTWADSFYVKRGSWVEFRALDVYSHVVSSLRYLWG